MNASARKISQLRLGSRRTGQDNIAATLGEEILSGARKPGERMPSDADMHKMFGVSRVVTREVIKTLAAKGLVVSKMKVGTTVLDLTHWNWLDSDVLSWRANVGLDMDFLAHLTVVRSNRQPRRWRRSVAHAPISPGYARRSPPWPAPAETGASSPKPICVFTWRSASRPRIPSSSPSQPPLRRRCSRCCPSTP